MENRKVVTLIAQDLIGQPPRKRILRQSADSPPHALPGSRRCMQNILMSLVFSNFHIVGFCPLFMLWDFVHFLCCGILSCGILSCGILSVGILSGGILSCGILSRIRDELSKLWMQTWMQGDIFDFITLELAKKCHPNFFFDHYRIGPTSTKAESSGNSLLTNI